MKTKLISERFWNLDQSWHFQRTVRTTEEGFKLRVEIRRNAYDFQSFARCQVWSNGSWNTVVSSPIDLCLCRSASYVQSEKKVNRSLFEKDADRLIAEALEVIA